MHSIASISEDNEIHHTWDTKEADELARMSSKNNFIEAEPVLGLSYIQQRSAFRRHLSDQQLGQSYDLQKYKTNNSWTQ